MGQAKNRGNFEQRLSTALPRLPKVASPAPIYIECSQCSEHLTDFVSVPQMVVDGLSHVFVALCVDCSFFSFHLVLPNARETLGILNFVECLECEASRFDFST